MDPENINSEWNTEIEEALKQFEQKSAVEEKEEIEQAPKVSRTPKMIEWVMKYSGGAIKDETQAAYVLFGFAILFFGLSFYFFYTGGRS